MPIRMPPRDSGIPLSICEFMVVQIVCWYPCKRRVAVKDTQPDSPSFVQPFVPKGRTVVVIMGQNAGCEGEVGAHSTEIGCKVRENHLNSDQGSRYEHPDDGSNVSGITRRHNFTPKKRRRRSTMTSRIRQTKRHLLFTCQRSVLLVSDAQQAYYRSIPRGLSAEICRESGV